MLCQLEYVGTCAISADMLKAGLCKILLNVDIPEPIQAEVYWYPGRRFEGGERGIAQVAGRAVNGMQDGFLFYRTKERGKKPPSISPELWAVHC